MTFRIRFKFIRACKTFHILARCIIMYYYLEGKAGAMDDGCPAICRVVLHNKELHNKKSRTTFICQHGVQNFIRSQSLTLFFIMYKALILFKFLE